MLTCPHSMPVISEKSADVPHCRTDLAKVRFWPSHGIKAAISAQASTVTEVLTGSCHAGAFSVLLSGDSLGLFGGSKSESSLTIWTWEPKQPAYHRAWPWPWPVALSHGTRNPLCSREPQAVEPATAAGRPAVSAAPATKTALPHCEAYQGLQ